MTPTSPLARQQGRWLRIRWILVLSALVVLAGCGSDDGDVIVGPAMSTDSQAMPTSVADPTTTPTADPTTTPPTPECTPPPATTSSEPTTTISLTTSTTTTTVPTTRATDPVLAGHQQRLADLGYWLGPVDGQLGSMTRHAVTAFQKAEGLPRTGNLDALTVERLSVASSPIASSSSGRVLEIDLSRQILLVVADGVVTRVYDIATGSAATPTPPGQFEIDREIDGYRQAPLGTLYRPKYFNGGIALHGYTSVPAEPASHGCVRLTYPAMDDLWATGVAPIGTTVLVY